MAKVFDVSRPRVLFEDVPDGVFEELAVLAPTHKRVTRNQAVHPSDWDLLVSFADGVRDPGPYHVLSIGANALKGNFPDDTSHIITFSRTSSTLARGAYSSDGLPSSLSALVEKSIVAHAISGDTDRRAMWRASTFIRAFGFEGAVLQDDLLKVLQPFAQVGEEGLVHAFSMQRNFTEDQTTTVWALPSDTTHIVAWMQTFLEHLRSSDPERYPRPVAWRTSEKWSTAELASAVASLEDVQERRASALAALDAEEAETAREVQIAQESAAAGAQRLLTRDGDDLVDAVRCALTDLGFTVTVMDNHHDTRTGAKLEDLRVADSAAPDWVALAEVKGYTKGAKASDVAQIVGRPPLAYLKEIGSEANSLWHIVNTFRNDDPSSRPRALSGADVDLQVLVDASGALIDTRELFLAQKTAVDDEARERVRAGLRAVTGRWTFTNVQEAPRSQ